MSNDDLDEEDTSTDDMIPLLLGTSDPKAAVCAYQDIIDQVILGSSQSLTHSVSESVDSVIEKATDDTPPAVNPSIQGGTKQIRGDIRFFGDQIEAPPIDVRIFATAPERSTRLLRCIHTYSRNTVGMGWEVRAYEAVPADAPEDLREQIAQEIALVTPLFRRPNPKDFTFTRLMFKVKLDIESTGNGYMEVVRDQDTRLDPLGTIRELWRVPTIDCRIMREGIGFVQIRSTKKVYFKNFGDPRVMNKDTGKFHTKINPRFDPAQPVGKSNEITVPIPGQEPLPIEQRANEIIHFNIPCIRNDYYGMPRYVSAAAAVAGNWLLSGRSVNFFSNDAVPRLIITVSGGKLTSESVSTIRDLLNATSKGPSNHGRVVVLQAEPKRAGITTDQYKTEIDVKPLLVGVSEEMSFGGYRQRNDEEIREAFNIGKAFFTSDDVNRANAAASRKITNEQEFEPDRIDMEEFINGTIMESFRVRKVGFFFKRLKLVDEEERGNIDSRYSTMASLSVNEIRQRAGLPAFPSTYKFADKPWQVALLEMQLGVKELIEYEDEGEEEEEAGDVTRLDDVNPQEETEGETETPGSFSFPDFGV